jgi:hypothetical protein
MGFLKRVAVRATDEMRVSIEDIYDGDPQYQQFIKFATDLLYKFSKKFQVDDDEMLEIFIKNIKKVF